MGERVSDGDRKDMLFLAETLEKSAKRGGAFKINSSVAEWIATLLRKAAADD